MIEPMLGSAADEPARAELGDYLVRWVRIFGQELPPSSPIFEFGTAEIDHGWAREPSVAEP
jgi:hypothetical protein